MIYVFATEDYEPHKVETEFSNHADLRDWLLTNAQRFDNISIIEGKRLDYKIHVEILDDCSSEKD